MSISDLIVVMNAGVIQQVGAPQQIYDDPRNLFVAKFLGNPPINVFRGRIHDGKLVVMNAGVIQQVGAPQQIYDDPRNLFVAKFLGNPPINVFRGRIHDGKLWIGDAPVLQQVGAPQQIYDDPRNLFVAKFLGNPPINVFRGRIHDGKLWIGDAPVLACPEGKEADVTVGIRPEGFTPDANGVLTCGLHAVEVMGRDISVVCSHPSAETNPLRAIIRARDAVDAGQSHVRFRLDPAKVFLFDADSGERLDWALHENRS